MKNIYKVMIGLAIGLLILAGIGLLTTCKTQSYNDRPCNMGGNGRK
jgi:hypothetical protein